MVNPLNVGAGISAFYTTLSTVKSVYSGQDTDTLTGRAKKAAIAGAAGAAIAFIAPPLAGASTFKTVVALGTVALNAPSIISHVKKGDNGRGNPYGSVSARAMGAAQQVATGAAAAYLAYQFPEPISAVASTAASVGWTATAWTASTALTVAWGGAKLAGSALYYGGSALLATVNGVATVVNAVGDAANAVFGEGEAEL